MECSYKKDRVFNISLSLIFALIISFINISHLFLYKMSDFILDKPSPISLLIPPFSGFKIPIAGETISSRFFWIQKGEILTKYHLEPLNIFFKDPLIIFVIYSFLVFIVLLFFLKFINAISKFKKTSLLTLVLVVVLYAKFTATYSELSIYTFPFIGLLGLMIVFFQKNVVRALNIIIAVMISFIYNFNPFLLFSYSIAGGFALYLYKKDEKEIDYILPFILGSFLLAIIVGVFDLYFNLAVYDDLLNIAWSLTVLPVLYIIIQFLKVYSSFFKKYDIMNYLDLDHPLLKLIREKAPGTYQHTLSMANMAETVANEIGANGLLCRAGAYFHDIGKTKHPEYFIENQDGENPHHSLSPLESARMIMLHVTDGLKMAEEYNLPEYISQFIDKHHGTTILEYFYEKEAALSENGEGVNLEDFRYPGRKPDNKETAVLMIIDAVEAASRTLKEPSIQDIETLITRIVFSKLLFNQLNQSGITLTDLRKMIVTLINILKSNSHTRVKYPWQTKNIKKEN